MLIDDAIVLGAQAKLIEAALCAGNVKADHGEPSKDDKLPYANVFISVDDAAPAGDARTGIVDLNHNVKLVVEVIQKHNTARALKTWLGLASEGIMQTLLPSLEWAVLSGQPFLEGVASVRRVYDLPPDGNHIVGRVQVQISLLARSDWAPDAESLSPFAILNAGVDMGNGEPPVIAANISVPTE